MQILLSWQRLNIFTDNFTHVLWVITVGQWLRHITLAWIVTELFPSLNVKNSWPWFKCKFFVYCQAIGIVECDVPLTALAKSAFRLNSYWSKIVIKALDQYCISSLTRCLSHTGCMSVSLFHSLYLYPWYICIYWSVDLIHVLIGMQACFIVWFMSWCCCQILEIIEIQQNSADTV